MRHTREAMTQQKTNVSKPTSFESESIRNKFAGIFNDGALRPGGGGPDGAGGLGRDDADGGEGRTRGDAAGRSRSWGDRMEGWTSVGAFPRRGCNVGIEMGAVCFVWLSLLGVDGGIRNS